MKDLIECRTQAEVDACCAAGNIAVVRTGRFEAWGSSHVVAWESSHVEARGSAHIVAWGSAHVEAWGSAHVEAWGSAHVVAWESAHVEAWESAHVEARESVSVHKHSGPHDKPKVKGGVIIEVPRLDTAEKWCSYYGVKVTRGIATLYKAVHDDFRSAHGADYSPGAKPEAPGWDPVPECGGGLHFSFHPSAARRFDSSATRFVACPVRVSDIVVHPDGLYPDKCKAARVVGKGCVEVDQYGALIAGAKP